MSYCSKCGQELNGRYCSNCGHDNQKKKERKERKKNEKLSKALDWIKEKAKAVGGFIARHKKPVILSATAFVAVLTTVIVLVSVLSNIYRVGKVAKIELGMQTSQVEKILGEPSEKDDYAWYYYEKKAEKKFDKTNELFEKMMNADSEKKAEKLYNKLSDVYEDIEKMTYKFIMVKFNGNGEVTEVFLDKNHKYDELDDYATEEKIVKKLELDKDSIDVIQNVDAEGKHLNYEILSDAKRVTYSVKFKDGSFYRKAQTVSVDMDDKVMSATLEWEDDISTYKRVIPISLMAIIDENGTLVKWCKNEENVAIPSVIKAIKREAFKGQSNVKNVIIPDSVTSIGSSAFENCTSLTSVTIGNGVTEIGSSAFRGCTSLTSVIIPDSVTSIGFSSFCGCSSLENMTLPFVGGRLAETSESKSTVFGYIFGTTSYDGSIAVKQYFSYSSEATYYIPSSLKTITVTGGNVFYGAFYGCTSLRSVTIGDGITSIGTYAFYACTGLTSVIISDSVTDVDGQAFRDCKNLTIYCEASEEPSGWDSNWNNSDRPVVWGYTGE